MSDNNNTNNQLSDAWVDFVAGWCSGAVAVVACQPIDTVLTRWQAAAVAGATATTTTAAALSRQGRQKLPLLPASSWTVAARHFTQTAGWTALWRGSGAMITAVPAQNALLMGGYGVGLEYSKKYGQQRRPSSNDENNSHHHHHYAAIFVGGCTGGVLQSFLMSPVELVKVSQQCAGTPGPTAARQVWQGLAVVGATPMIRCFSAAATATATAATPRLFTAWSGLGATLLRDGIPHGVWFVSYEYAKTFLEERNRNHNHNHAAGAAAGSSNSAPPSVTVPLISGAVAAFVAWAVGYPADLIKTRIQAAAANGEPCIGIMATARQIIRESPPESSSSGGMAANHGNNWMALYRGFGLKLMRAVPASMIGFTVYEAVKEQITTSTKKTY